jgi:SNF2 family DNA or RNA helicase
MEGHLGTYSKFVTKYEVKILEGDDHAERNLKHRIDPFMLRRSKEEVGPDLPEKIEMEDYCGLTTEQKSLYRKTQGEEAEPLRDKIRRGARLNFNVNILPVLQWLKQICDHPALRNGNMTPLLCRSEKFDLAIEKIEEIIEKNERAVIFSDYRVTLDLFETYLKDKQIAYIRIDGSTRHREQLIEKLNSGFASIALCSIRAGGEGINLYGANHVLHFDRWWNWATEIQATDRVHRIGQTKTVYIHKMIVKGTLEEKIDSIIQRKKEIFDKLIGLDTRKMEWTKDELLDILAPLKE